jgi:hypothetical protein
MTDVRTSAICDQVQEAIAAGEEPDAAHMASCTACRRIREVVSRAADLREDAAVPLSHGFRARLMAGGKARFARRRRRQRTFTALGAAAAAAALWVALSSGDVAPPPALPSHVASQPEESGLAPPAAEIDALLAPTARWDYVEEPLEPYHRLARSIEAADSDNGGTP